MWSFRKRRADAQPMIRYGDHVATFQADPPLWAFQHNTILFQIFAQELDVRIIDAAPSILSVVAMKTREIEDIIAGYLSEWGEAFEKGEVLCVDATHFLEDRAFNIAFHGGESLNTWGDLVIGIHFHDETIVRHTCDD